MDQQTLLTIFVGLSALAMLIQAGMLVGMLVVARSMEKKVTSLMPEIQSITASSKKVLQEAQRLTSELGDKATSIAAKAEAIAVKAESVAETAKGQVVRFDALLTDAGNRARVQLDRAELVLDDTMGRTQRTVAMVQDGVVAPIREVHGIIKGVRAAIAHLGSGRRPTVDHVTSDEEMFI